jgi:hypothetical protein
MRFSTWRMSGTAVGRRHTCVILHNVTFNYKSCRSIKVNEVERCSLRDHVPHGGRSISSSREENKFPCAEGTHYYLLREDNNLSFRFITQIVLCSRSSERTNCYLLEKITICPFGWSIKQFHAQSNCSENNSIDHSRPTNVSSKLNLLFSCPSVCVQWRR